MKKLLCVFSLLISFFNNSLHAQVTPSIQWAKSLGGSDEDNAYSIQETENGGFIVAGYSYSTDEDVSGNHGYTDYWIVKLDSGGNLIWQKCLGGTGPDEAHSIFQTFDGGYIIAGNSNSDNGDVSGNHGNKDFWIVKIDSYGNLGWQKSLGGNDLDGTACIQSTTDKGFIVAGGSYSNDGDVSGNHGSDDYWIVKLDSSGNLLWQKCFGGSGVDWASSIHQTTDGGFIVGGSAHSNDGDVSGNHGEYDYWILKLDSVGNLLWQKCLGGSGDDQLREIQQASDGGYLAVGSSWSNDGDVTGNHSSYDYWIVKLDENGDLLWQKSLGGSMHDYGFGIRQTFDGGFVVTGASRSEDGDISGHHGDTYWKDYWIVKINSNGDLIWQKSLGGNLDDHAQSIEQCLDGGFIVAGRSYSNDGEVSGNHTFYDPYCYCTVTTMDYWIVKLSSEIATEIISAQCHSVFLSPNPVQNLLTINLSTQANDFTIQAYDLQGKGMNCTSSNFKSQTSNSIQLNTQNLSAGFYTLQIINNKTGESKVGKFVKE